MLAGLVLAAATCPIAPPEALALYSPEGCGPYRSCANGPVTWQVVAAPTPTPSFGRYRIQPCDTLTWSLGDGTTQTLIGTDQITHDYYLLPGNYTVAVTVTNALGSARAKLDAVIATSPARLSFVAPTPVREGSGDATMEVVRELDLTRAISADAVLADRGAVLARVPLQFAPGRRARASACRFPTIASFRAGASSH
jgi:hypothetical protein